MRGRADLGGGGGFAAPCHHGWHYSSRITGIPMWCISSILCCYMMLVFTTFLQFYQIFSSATWYSSSSCTMPNNNPRNYVLCMTPATIAPSGCSIANISLFLGLSLKLHTFPNSSYRHSSSCTTANIRGTTTPESSTYQSFFFFGGGGGGAQSSHSEYSR